MYTLFHASAVLCDAADTFMYVLLYQGSPLFCFSRSYYSFLVLAMRGEHKEEAERRKDTELSGPSEGSGTTQARFSFLLATKYLLCPTPRVPATLLL